MILALKFLCLLDVFMFSPNIIFGGIRGKGFSASNVFFVACGLAGFVTLQWLI